MRTLLRSLILCLLLTACTQPNTPAESVFQYDNYDAIELLGMGNPATEHLPQDPIDETALLRYGGWSLNELAESSVGKQYLSLDPAYAREEWAKKTLPPGVYSLREMHPVPVVLMATALLAERVKHGRIDFDRRSESPFLAMVDINNCKGITKDTGRIGLYWGEDWGADGTTATVKLFVDKNYCNTFGGGVWEASM